MELKSLFDFIQTGGAKVFDPHQFRFGAHGQVANGANPKKLKCLPSPDRQIQTLNRFVQHVIWCQTFEFFERIVWVATELTINPLTQTQTFAG